MLCIKIEHKKKDVREIPNPLFFSTCIKSIKKTWKMYLKKTNEFEISRIKKIDKMRIKILRLILKAKKILFVGIYYL